MKILVTGAKGFVGRNLCENLKNLRDGKNRTRPALTVDEIYEYDIDTDPVLLEEYCTKANFVFNLAGVNRPKNEAEFMQGNFGFASTLLDMLKRHGNTCPVMLSSSIQATLIGRYGQSDYGKSKLAGEELFFTYAQETGAPVLVYRFPNLFGKWCRPNYNSAVATFCYNTAHDLPITVNDRATELELLYIDDLVEEMLDALRNAAKRGVDVRLVLPGIPDKKLVFRLTRSYYVPLLRAGVKIYEYTPGFIHAKQFVADDKAAAVGTINLDYRSLYLHFENGCWFCGCQAVQDVRADFEALFPQCENVTPQYSGQRSLALRGVQCVFRLFSPLM